MFTIGNAQGCLEHKHRAQGGGLIAACGTPAAGVSAQALTINHSKAPRAGRLAKYPWPGKSRCYAVMQRVLSTLGL